MLKENVVVQNVVNLMAVSVLMAKGTCTHCGAKRSRFLNVDELLGDKY